MSSAETSQEDLALTQSTQVNDSYTSMLSAVQNVSNSGNVQIGNMMGGEGAINQSGFQMVALGIIGILALVIGVAIIRKFL